MSCKDKNNCGSGRVILSGISTIINAYHKFFCSIDCVRKFSKSHPELRIIILNGNEELKTIISYEEIRESIW